MSVGEQRIKPAHVGDLKDGVGRGRRGGPEAVVIGQRRRPGFLQEKMLAGLEQRDRVANVVDGATAEDDGVDVGCGQFLV